MDSPDVVAGLRAGAPDAGGQLYDAYSEDLYQYCWLILRRREKAYMAMRDAIILADARSAELTDPAMLKAWLFGIARAECDRHRPGSAGESDEPVARAEQPDVSRRIMAWNAVLSLPPGEREALDLVTRHGMTAPQVAVVLGLSPAEAQALTAGGRQHLQHALAAEILIHRETRECGARAEMLRSWTGTVTPAVRDRLLRHASSCPACLPRLPRNVPMPAIFGLLPRPALPEGGSGACGKVAPDRRLAAPPPGAPRRKTVPRHSATRRPGPHGTARRRPGRRTFAGAAAVLAAAGVLAALAAGSFSGHARLSGATRHLPGAAAAPAQAGAGRPITPPGSAPATPAAATGNRNLPSPTASASDGPAVRLRRGHRAGRFSRRPGRWPREGPGPAAGRGRLREQMPPDPVPGRAWTAHPIGGSQ